MTHTAGLRSVFGENDQAHPAVWYLFNKAGDYYVGGTVEGIQLPPHYDFVELRSTADPYLLLLHPITTSSHNLHRCRRDPEGDSCCDGGPKME